MLRVRTQAKDQAAGILAERRSALSLAEAELEAKQRAVAECRDQSAETVRRMEEQQADANGVAASWLASFRARLSDLRLTQERLSDAVEHQREAVRLAGVAVDEALEALTKASQDERVIEKHRESWKENLRREANKREQKTLDEIGLNLTSNYSQD